MMAIVSSSGAQPTLVPLLAGEATAMLKVSAVRLLLLLLPVAAGAASATVLRGPSRWGACSTAGGRSVSTEADCDCVEWWVITGVIDVKGILDHTVWIRTGRWDWQQE